MAERNENEDFEDSVSHEFEMRMPGIDENLNINRMMSIMLEENRRRDLVMERLIDKVTTPMSEAGRSEDHFQIMPDLTKNIRYFDGEAKSNASEWLKNLKSMKLLHNWPDQFVLETARIHLVGGAKHWMLSKIEDISTFQDFENAFKKTFIGKVSLAEKWRLMEARIQKKEESLSNYFHEKVKLCKDLGLEFMDTREQILVGLYDKNLCDVTSGKMHIDVDDLLHSLEEFERISNRRKLRHREIIRNEKHFETKPDTRNQQQQSEQNKTVHEQRSRYLPPRNDKNQPLCFVCKKYGHTSKYCRTNSSNGTSQSNQNQSNQDRNVNVCITSMDFNKMSQKYFQEAMIDGKPIQTYVDLGSQGNLIRKSSAEQLNLEIKSIKTPLTVRGFGYGKVDILAEIEVEIEIDQAKAFTKLLVVPDNYLDIPLLLGQPFTEQKHIVIIKRGDQLRIFEDEHIEDQSNLTKIQIPTLPMQKVNLWSNEKKVIPKNYIGFLEVYIKDNLKEDLYIESTNDERRCIPRCVVAVNENLQTYVPIINLNNADLSIYKNEKVARAVRCCEVQEENIEVNKNNLEIFEENSEDKIKKEDIHINDHISTETQMKLIKILNQYSDCFANSLKELGCTPEFECKIETTTDQPVTYRPYRLSHSERAKVREMVEELKNAGIIVDSNSSYASPILIVKKKTGDERFCIDYRGLNKITTKMEFPLPIIEDQLDRLSGKNYYTSLDMKSGYYQVPVEKNSRAKTAFVTSDGIYEFKKMPFGLLNGPAIFSKMINHVQGPLRFTIAMAYMDDILLPSVTEEEGLNNLEEILIVLRRANLKLNLKKCFFLEENIEYLGYEISKGEIRPGRKKLKSVSDFPTPENVKNIRQFLGLTGYFRKFIKSYAIKAKPLTKLLSKNTKWIWDQDQQEAFELLKEELTSTSVLRLYDPKAYTEVHTDASMIGLGAILLQRDSNDEMHPVAFISRQTTPEEQKYHSGELETLCVTWALERLRTYLIGIHFVVVTDCNALRTTFTKKNLIPRIGRWCLKLLDYDYEIKHRPGKNMEHVDALSRNPIEVTEETDCGEGIQLLITHLDEEDWLCVLQRKDQQIQRIADVLQKKEPENIEERRLLTEYEIRNGRVYKNENGNLKWAVPKRIRWRIVQKCHDELGHLALEKTLQKIKEKYWFARMRNYVKGYIGSCVKCLYNKTPGEEEERVTYIPLIKLVYLYIQSILTI